MNQPAPQARQRVRIGDLLVQNKLLSQAQLEEALAEQKRSGHKLGRVLVQQGYVDEDSIINLLSRQLAIPVVDLKHYQFKADTVALLPETHARRFRALALSDARDHIVVGMADPTDIFAFDELQRIIKRPVKLAIVKEADLLRAIDMVYRRTEEIHTLAEELGEELSEGDIDLAALGLTEGQTDTPVIKLLQSMFEDAAQMGASDIHIEPEENLLRIRQRIDGVLHEQIIEGRRVAGALVTRLKLMSALDISEKRLPQDGRFNIKIRTKSIDVRLSTMPVQYGESVVLRLLDQSAAQRTLDDLGMPPLVLSRFERQISRPHGMILVTGPTGSGKTTTLYAALNRINQASRKIITAEDPVEYRLPRINQVQVNTKINLSFARVLRTALRQDPDIIMIGEMRDQETAEIGLRAAMTGHLVLSTLHTNSAIATIERLIDLGAAGYLVAAALEAVVAQRLVRRVCESCGEPTAPTPQQRAFLLAQMGSDFERMSFKHGPGCTYCSNTGYRGRIGVYELIEMDRPLSDALRREDMVEFARLAREQKGFRSLSMCALDYAAQGITSLEEVLRLAGEVEDISELEHDDPVAPDAPVEAGS
ncbi:MAG TPA: ATPase, T2SS/T4P/T4SS family [Arenimonas sp.]|nr:ATPase, T2SS/T4P/T4SS family [Arenimonas sp.]